MNHAQMARTEFEFTNANGAKTPLKSKLDDNMVISTHFVSTFDENNDIKDIFPLSPVVPFTAETMPTKGLLKSYLTIQDLILLIEVHDIQSIGVFDEDLEEILIPSEIDIDDARSLLKVNDDKDQDVSSILETLKKANTIDSIEERFRGDDSRSASDQHCLNDWVEFVNESVRYTVFSFLSFEVDTKNKTLLLTINSKHSI